LDARQLKQFEFAQYRKLLYAWNAVAREKFEKANAKDRAVCGV
jgi:hypothetical protein